MGRAAGTRGKYSLDLSTHMQSTFQSTRIEEIMVLAGGAAYRGLD